LETESWGFLLGERLMSESATSLLYSNEKDRRREISCSLVSVAVEKDFRVTLVHLLLRMASAF